MHSPPTSPYVHVVGLMMIFAMVDVAASEPRQFTGAGSNAHQAKVIVQADPAAPPQGGPQLSPSPLSSRPRLLQLEESEIRARGDGSFDTGLNEVGRLGYQLFLVTSELETGKVGFHLFKFPRWNLPGPPPTYQFRRIDRESIDRLGNGKLSEGLKVLEREDWHLAAVTTIKNGAIGWYYFEREARNP